MATSTTSKVTFGIKGAKRPAVSSALTNDDATEDQGKAAKSAKVVAFGARGAETDGPQEETGPLVIPLQKVNKWNKLDTPEAGAPTAEDSAYNTAPAKIDSDAAAAAALLDDARRLEEGGDTEEKLAAIPLLMQNRAPGTAETQDDKQKFKLDLAQRPDNCDAAVYDSVPIAQFGEAMLRGMGWQEGQAIGGTVKGLCEPVEFVHRPHGLGLGATKDLSIKGDRRYRDKKYVKPGEERKAVTTLGSMTDASGKVKHIKGVSETLYKAEDLRLIRGARVVVTGGVHERQVGRVTKLHHLRVRLQLETSGAEVDVAETDVKVVPKRAYKALLKDLQEGKASNAHRSGGSSSGSSSNSSKGSRRSDRGPTWVHPEIRVRIISESFAKGRHYNVKAKVMDVLGPDNINVLLPSGALVEGLRTKHLETVIPRDPDARVLILRGEHKGRTARIIERDKRKERVLVQVAGEPGVSTLTFDDVCEFVGALRNEDW